MEIKTTGKVLVTAKIENLQDLLDVERGMLSQDQVRFVEVSNADFYESRSGETHGNSRHDPDSNDRQFFRH